jgi:hypothetical protein
MTLPQRLTHATIGTLWFMACGSALHHATAESNAEGMLSSMAVAVLLGVVYHAFD